MALELNLTQEDRTGEGFKEYPGSNILQRPLIVAERRIPMRAAYLMGMRILHPESHWMFYWYDCDDRVTYHPDGERLKIGSRGKLEDYLKYGQFANGAIEFDEQKYPELPWKELKRSELKLGEHLSAPEAKASPLWFELSGENQSLLDAFVDTAYTKGNYQSAMGAFLDEKRRTNAWMRAFYVVRLFDLGGSGAGGVADLGYDCGRLVGVAPEALARLEKRLYDEKKINVDFMSAVEDAGIRNVNGADKNVVSPYEIQSKSGFQPNRSYDVEVAPGSGKSYDEADIDEAFNFAKQSGQKDPEIIIRIAKERLQSGKDERT